MARRSTVDGALDRGAASELASWRAPAGRRGHEPTRALRTRTGRVELLDGRAVRWSDGPASVDPSVEASGVAAVWDASGLRWTRRRSAARARVRRGVPRGDGASARDRSRTEPLAAHARRLLTSPSISGRDRRRRASGRRLAPQPAPRPRPAPTANPACAARPGARPPRPARASRGRSSSALSPTRIARGRRRRRRRDDVEDRAGDRDAVAFTIGPGPFSFARTPTRIELRFSTDTHVASTSLAVRAAAPAGGGRRRRSRSRAGRVSLSLLGVQEERPGSSTSTTRR